MAGGSGVAAIFSLQLSTLGGLAWRSRRLTAPKPKEEPLALPLPPPFTTGSRSMEKGKVATAGVRTGGTPSRRAQAAEAAAKRMDSKPGRPLPSGRAPEEEDAPNAGLVPRCWSSARLLPAEAATSAGREEETASGRTHVSQGVGEGGEGTQEAGAPALVARPSNRLSRTAARWPRCRSAQAATAAALAVTVERTAGSPTVA